MNMEESNNNAKKKNKGLIICIIILIICLLLALYFSFFRKKEEPPIVAEPSATASSEELPDNPIDFASLKAKNEEIYAWIKIPGTVIDFPIVQSYNDNEYYLRRDAYGNKDNNGAIFTELYNSQDFSDPNTVIYGHNMEDTTMFSTLHNFSNKEFFDKNEFFYIYTPGHIMKYRIVAAYKYDKRHLLNSFDFRDEKVFADYLEYVKNPNVMSANTRAAELSVKSKLVTLSTCADNGRNRYLVQGVRISDERTK